MRVRTQQTKDKFLINVLLGHLIVITFYALMVGEFYHVFAIACLALLTPVLVVTWKPGSLLSRSVIALALIIYSALLIHLSNGLVEMHFHVFVVIGLLSIYYDWQVLVMAGTAITLHHLIGFLLPVYHVYAPNPDINIYLLHVGFVFIFTAILSYQSYNISRSTANIYHSNKVLIENDLAQLLQFVQQVTAGDLSGKIELKSQAVPVVASDELGDLSRLHNQLVLALHSIGNTTVLMGQALREIIARSQESLDHINNLCERLVHSTGSKNQFFLPRKLVQDELTLSQFSMKQQIEQVSAQMVVAAMQLDALQHQLETKVAQQTDLNDELARIIGLKSRFFASLSHELRTPLTIIMGHSEMLAIGLEGELNPKQQKLIDQIFQSTLNMRQLINDILEFSKLEAGKISVYPEAVPLRVALTKADNEIKVLAQSKALSLTLNLEKEVIALADPNRLHQVLLNLLSNAIKFTPSGGSIQVQAQPLELTADGSWRQPDGTPWRWGNLYPQIKLEAGQWVGLQVADTGLGITPEQLPVIFEEFEQLENGGQGGTGLGLPIVKSLTRLMGGQVAVESETGRGTTFTVLLPAWQAPVQLAPNSNEKSAVRPAPFKLTRQTS